MSYRVINFPLHLLSETQNLQSPSLPFDSRYSSFHYFDFTQTPPPNLKDLPLIQSYSRIQALTQHDLVIAVMTLRETGSTFRRVRTINRKQFWKRAAWTLELRNQGLNVMNEGVKDTKPSDFKLRCSKRHRSKAP